jgi:hypothetical protein
MGASTLSIAAQGYADALRGFVAETEPKSIARTA